MLIFNINLTILKNHHCLPKHSIFYRDILRNVIEQICLENLVLELPLFPSMSYRIQLLRSVLSSVILLSEALHMLLRISVNYVLPEQRIAYFLQCVLSLKKYLQ